MVRSAMHVFLVTCLCHVGTSVMLGMLLLIIARRNWRHCLCKSSGDKQCILSSLGVLGRSATSTGLHWPPGQLYAGRATNAQPAGYSLSLTWRAPCLQKKHGGLSVVCSGSLCIIAGRFYSWSLFSYGRNRKEVLY